MTTIRRLTGLALAAALITPVTAADARAGDIDRSFGDDGYARDTWEGSWGYDVAVDADNRVLVAGEGGGGLVVTRFTRTGARDRTFGRRGSATVDLEKVPSLGSASRRRTMRPTHEVHIFAGPRSKITVVGLGQSQDWGPPFRRKIFVARFTAGGRLDDGSLVVGGRTWEEVSVPEVPVPFVRGDDAASFVAKYDIDGTVDQAFGKDGVVWLPAGGNACCTPGVPVFIPFYFSSVELSYGWSELGAGPSGEIILAGRLSVPEGGPTAAWLMRLSPSGILDPTFGAGGASLVEIPSRTLTAMEVHGDQYYLAGPGDGTWVVARVDFNGVLDESYGSGGIGVVSGVGPISHGRTVGPSALGVYRGRLWAIGPGYGQTSFAAISDRDRLVVRLTENGQPDDSFGLQGFVWLPRGRVYNVGHGIDFQGKGRALIAATVQGADRDLGVIALKA